MKYFILTFGCQMNRSDSERIASVFENADCHQSPDMESADIVVVTMCSVRQMAADRVFGLEQKFRQIKKINRNLKTILTGCVVGSDKTRFAEIFDHILDINTLLDWPKTAGIGKKIPGDGYFSTAPLRAQSWSVLIPISQGCDNYCSYCVVPYTRGPLICRPWKDIISEAKNAVRGGAKEIWLLGQNVNNYSSGNVNFARLLRLVNEIPGDFWIRFTSPHPKDFSGEAVTAMAECAKVTPYLNLPVQSGDNDVLRAMKRPYTVGKYKKLVSGLRQAFRKHRQGMEAQLAISTDVIVGFPAETKEQFANTAKTFETIKYDMAYIARYSRRAGTVAEKLPDNVTPAEKKRRENRINNIVKRTALAHNKKYLGKTMEVIIDELRGGFALGKTRTYKTVKFIITDKAVCQGDMVSVRITGVKSFGLAGKIL